MMDKRFLTETGEFPKELNLLLQLLRWENGGVSLPQESPAGGVDWDRMLALVLHHRMHPVLYRLLKKAGCFWVPSEFLQALQQECRRSTLWMLRLTGEMERICKGLGDHGIRTLLLKGPVLAFEWYGDVSLRTSTDLDILVPIDELPAVDTRLRELGYTTSDMIPRLLNGWRWRQHHAGYYHPLLKVHLEIHWRLSPGPGKEPRFEAMWERRRVSGLSRVPIHFPGTDDLLLYLVTHGARHGWFRLRWLADIAVAARRTEDWQRTEKLFRYYQSGHLLGQAQLLVTGLLDKAAIPDHVGAGVLRRSLPLAGSALYFIRTMTVNPPPEVVRRYKRYLFRIKPVRQKILYLLSTLYPYPKDAETLPLPRPVHFLYFPLRPLLWAWRKARKNALT